MARGIPKSKHIKPESWLYNHFLTKNERTNWQCKNQQICFRHRKYFAISIWNKSACQVFSAWSLQWLECGFLWCTTCTSSTISWAFIVLSKPKINFIYYFELWPKINFNIHLIYRVMGFGEEILWWKIQTSWFYLNQDSRQWYQSKTRTYI